MNEFEEVQALIDEHAPSISEGPFFNRQGEQIDWVEFARTKLSPETREDVVGQEQVGDVGVSTVWLGWSEGNDALGRPLIFETMLFPLEVDQPREAGRYATEAEAEAGHRRVVELMRSGLLGPLY